MTQLFYFWVFIQREKNPTKLKQRLHPHAHGGIIYRSQDAGTTLVLSAHRRVSGQRRRVGVYNGMLLGHKNEGILASAATWMEREGPMLCEISRPAKTP